MSKVDVEVEVVDGGGYSVDQGATYKHPSYGMIRINHRQCGGGGVKLFGSDVGHNSLVSITIENSQVTQDLGRNWYYGESVVTEVEMTSTQYAEMISRPNTQGVPCTIRYQKGVGHIQYRPCPDKIEYTEQKVRDLAEGFSDKLKSKMEDFNAILDKKGTISVSDRKALKDILQYLVRDVSDGVPFYIESLDKLLKDMVSEANNDLHAAETALVNRLGSAILEHPEALALLLEEKK